MTKMWGWMATVEASVCVPLRVWRAPRFDLRHCPASQERRRLRLDAATSEAQAEAQAEALGEQLAPAEAEAPGSVFVRIKCP